MPGGGLTTMIDVSIEETDRLMRDFFAIEEVNHREHEIQNVTVHTYDAAKGRNAGDAHSRRSCGCTPTSTSAATWSTPRAPRC